MTFQLLLYCCSFNHWWFSNVVYTWWFSNMWPLIWCWHGLSIHLSTFVFFTAPSDGDLHKRAMTGTFLNSGWNTSDTCAIKVISICHFIIPVYKIAYCILTSLTFFSVPPHAVWSLINNFWGLTHFRWQLCSNWVEIYL